MRALSELMDALSIQISALHGLPFPNVASSDHSSLKEHYGSAVAVTKERCIPVLEQFWGELEKCNNDEKEHWLQQDSAPPHTANIIIT